MKVYSPSQTKAYLESPIGWSLHYREGWSPRVIGRKELSGFLGQSFATAMERHHNDEHARGNLEVLRQIGGQYLTKKLDEAYELGYTVASKEQALLDNLPDHLDRAITKAVEYTPIPPEWKVLGVEESIPEAGNCRLDLLVDTPMGATFVDYKTKITLEGYAKDRTIMEWSQDWQFYHYAWALRRRGMECSSYHVALVVCAGSVKPSLHTFPIDNELLSMWESCAKEVWGQMERIERGEAIPIWAFHMTDRYGADPWADAIVSAKLHEHLMARNYIKRERYDSK